MTAQRLPETTAHGLRKISEVLIFYIMLMALQANEALFQTGWFIESLCTQVLVIFIIRTRGNPLKSRAHPLLGIILLLYLFLVELAKRGFYRWSAVAAIPANTVRTHGHKPFDI